MEQNDTENVFEQILWDTFKAVLWEKFIVLSAYIKHLKKMGLDRLLSGYKPWLIFQRTYVQL